MRLLSGKFREMGPGSGSLVCCGPLFGSEPVMEHLKRKGMKRVEGLEQLSSEDMVVLPVWGEEIETMDELRAHGIRILNTTCPRDAISHKLAYRLAREGYGVIVVGCSDSAAVRALMSRVAKGRREQMEALGESGKRAFAGTVVDATCGKDPDLRRIPEDVTHVAIIAQANVGIEAYRTVVAKAATRFEEVRAYNTVCRSVAARFQEAARLAELCDALLIVGDDNIETKEMRYLCKLSGNHEVYLTPSIEFIPPDIYDRHQTVGIVSSTATPDWILVNVVEELRRHGKAGVEEGPAAG